MKKLIITSIVFVLFGCKKDSKLIIEKPSGDASIYFREGIVEQGLMDSLSFTFFDKGAMQYLKGNYKKAKEFYKKANEIQPDNILILNVLGNVEADLDNYDRSVHYFQRSIELDSLDTNTYLNFGTAYNKLKDFDNSIAILKKGLSIETNERFIGFFYYNLANSYYKKDDYKTSYSYNEKALKLVKLEGPRKDVLQLKKALSEKIH